MDQENIEYDEINKLLEDKFPDFIIDNNYKDLPYLIAGDFARYILDNFHNNNLQKVKDCFIFIELLHIKGTKETIELATIGYLESLQNII
jgi:hypothetical protein